MSPIENVSRRRFLTGGIIAAGALVLGVRYYSRISSGDKLPHDTNADHATLHPSGCRRVGRGLEASEDRAGAWRQPIR